METWEPEIKPFETGIASLPPWRHERIACWPTNLPEEQEIQIIRATNSFLKYKGSVAWIMPAALDVDPEAQILSEMSRLGREHGSMCRRAKD